MTARKKATRKKSAKKATKTNQDPGGIPMNGETPVSLSHLAEQDWLPQKFVGELVQLKESSSELETHRLLLKVGEELLTHMTGIFFGEYKKNGVIREALEEKLYLSGNGKNLSFGNFLGFFRDLNKVSVDSILKKVLADSENSAVTEFAFHWKLLKEIVNAGTDSGFKEQVDQRKKGQTASKKNLLDFFDVLVNVRNIDAHPQGKASNPTRDWPQGPEYYSFVNPWLEGALAETLQKLHAIASHSPALVEQIHDDEGTADVLIEIGKTPRKEKLSLTGDDIDFLSTEKRYLFDESQKPYAKLYVNEIPSLDPKTSESVIKNVKAKQAEPALNELISTRLHSHTLDALDFIFLKEAAHSYGIGEAKLLALIEKIKKKMGFEGELIIAKQDQTRPPAFNPHWLTYFGRLSDNKATDDDDPYSTTNVHRRLWKEITSYLEHLVAMHLDGAGTKWVVKPNQFQIGALSYSYWGQIYPEESPFENTFAIGFAVAKKFKWGKAKNRKSALSEKLDAPSVVLYTTKFRKGLEDMDPDSVFLRRYLSANFELLGRERDALEELGVNVGDHEGDPSEGGGTEVVLDSRISTISDYFAEQDRGSGLVQLYSKIWTIEDFLSDGAISPEICGRFETELSLLLNLFANSIKDVSDFALAAGTNAETIHKQRDRARRMSKLLREKKKQAEAKKPLDAAGRADLKAYGESLGLKKYQIDSVLTRKAKKKTKEKDP